MFRQVAPAGAPVAISQVIRAATAALTAGDGQQANLKELAAKLAVRHAFGVSSGRTALAAILRSLSHLRPGRNVVAIPAYTCFTVPAAVARAGLRILPVEIDPETLDFDFKELNKLPGESLLCIVSSNLFGLVNNGPCIRAAARARGAFFVDDAAQAMGSTRDGIPAGMMGDVGFYSFGRGKALAALEGALIVTDSDEIAAALRDEVQKLPPASSIHSSWLLAQMLIYSVFLNPRLYWLPNSLPFLDLGTTEFEPGFPMYRMPPLVSELLARSIENLKKFSDIRRENARALAAALQGNPNFTLLRPPDGCDPNFIRFPLLARDAASRDRAVADLRSMGIGASPFYPSAICDIPGIDKHLSGRDSHCHGAETLSKRLLTLPTHPYVRGTDLKNVTDFLWRH